VNLRICNEKNARFAGTGNCELNRATATHKSEVGTFTRDADDSCRRFRPHPIFAKTKSKREISNCPSYLYQSGRPPGGTPVRHCAWGNFRTPKGELASRRRTEYAGGIHQHPTRACAHTVLLLAVRLPHVNRMCSRRGPKQHGEHDGESEAPEMTPDPREPRPRSLHPTGLC